MKDTSKTEIKVGVTVVLSLLLLIFIISWARNMSLTANRKHLLVRFQSVSGLEVGDQVTVNGVRQGNVEAIINDGTRVLANLSLDADTRLQRDAIISVDMLDLMGGKKVEIDRGTSDTLLDFSQVANGNFSADVPLVMKTVGTVMNEVPEIIKSLNESLYAIKTFIKDDSLKSNIRTTMQELSLMTTKINKFINSNSENVTSLVENSNKLANQNLLLNNFS